MNTTTTKTMKTKLQNLIKSGRDAALRHPVIALRRPCHCLVIPLTLLAVFSLLLASRAPAQTFRNLYSFTAAGYDSVVGANTNLDGADPLAGLVLSGNTLYGTTYSGGTNGGGTVFAVRTDGTGFTTLHTFTALSAAFFGTNSDGANPQAGLILSGSTLYGTTYGGGTNGYGTVFSLTTDGTGFTTLHTFTALSAAFSGTNSDGANPYAGLILLGGTLYGTAYYGGTNGNGTLFAVSTNGTGFTTLHTFTAYPKGSYTTSDGANPEGGLISSGSTLYGTAADGGAGGNGAVFAINTDGTGFTNLYSFTALSPQYFNNPDGANPFAGLVLSGNTLFGTTHFAGVNGSGTVFGVTTNGTGFTVLHSFQTSTNDGANPYAGLIVSGNTLFGTAGNGGNSFAGTLFAVNTNGSGFTTVHTFTNNPDGNSPHAALILSGNTLYGTTSGGGTNGYGMVFALTVSVSLPSIPLNLQLNGPNLVLTWGNPAFYLQTATGLAGPWTTIPGAASPYGAARTNEMQFFRLVSTNNP